MPSQEEKVEHWQSFKHFDRKEFIVTIKSISSTSTGKILRKQFPCGSDPIEASKTKLKKTVCDNLPDYQTISYHISLHQHSILNFKHSVICMSEWQKSKIESFCGIWEGKKNPKATKMVLAPGMAKPLSGQRRSQLSRRETALTHAPWLVPSLVPAQLTHQAAYTTGGTSDMIMHGAVMHSPHMA